MGFDCKTCGACCFSDSSEYVELESRDLARIERVKGRGFRDTICRESRGRWYLKMSDGHCAQLLIRGLRYTCAIYAIRPKTCRELTAGASACQEERSEKRARAQRLIQLRQRS